MARATWTEDALVNIKLRDDLYTVGQMLVSPFMRFFDVSNVHGIWDNIRLDQDKVLFQVMVGQPVMQNLVMGKIPPSSVTVEDIAFETRMIKPHLNFEGGFAFKGGRLIELDPPKMIDTTRARVVKERLELPEDRDLIEQYELTNMWGDQDLSDRLRRYFDTGVNRDDLKFEVFPGLWDDRETLRPLTRRLPVPYR